MRSWPVLSLRRWQFCIANVWMRYHPTSATVLTTLVSNTYRWGERRWRLCGLPRYKLCFSVLYFCVLHVLINRDLSPTQIVVPHQNFMSVLHMACEFCFMLLCFVTDVMLMLSMFVVNDYVLSLRTMLYTKQIPPTAAIWSSIND